MNEVLKVGDVIEFDNKLVSGIATITKVSEKTAFEKANGEKIRYVLNLNGTTKKILELSSPSEVIKKIEN